MNMGRSNNEEWLECLKEKVNGYKEPLPADAWSRLEKDMGVFHAGRPGLRRIRSVFRTVAAAAAVVVLFFALSPLFVDNRESGIPPSVSVVNDYTVKENMPQNNMPVAGVEPVEKENAGMVAPEKIIAANEVRSVNKDNIAGEVKEEKEKSLDKNDGVLIPEKAVAPDENNIARYKNKDDMGREGKTDVSNVSKDLTWEEYLKNNGDDPVKKRTGLWLALSVGNSGVSTFDPRTVDVPEGAVMEMSSFSEMTEIKDLMLYKRPENVAFRSGVSVIDAKYRHKQPVSFGITIGKNLSDKFTLETGLVYSLLNSDIENLQKDKSVRQTLHYLGIPLRLNWNFVNKYKYSVYTGIGGMVEKCVYGKVGSEKVKIKSVQTSLNFSVGVQYKFNSTVGVYFEPGLSYYLGMEKDGSLGRMGNDVSIKSIHSENPLGFTLQAGFRFSF